MSELLQHQQGQPDLNLQICRVVTTVDKREEQEKRDVEITVSLDRKMLVCLANDLRTQRGGLKLQLNPPSNLATTVMALASKLSNSNRPLALQGSCSTDDASAHFQRGPQMGAFAALEKAGFHSALLPLNRDPEIFTIKLMSNEDGRVIDSAIIAAAQYNEQRSTWPPSEDNEVEKDQYDDDVTTACPLSDPFEEDDDSSEEEDLIGSPTTPSSGFGTFLSSEDENETSAQPDTVSPCPGDIETQQIPRQALDVPQEPPRTEIQYQGRNLLDLYHNMTYQWQFQMAVVPTHNLVNHFEQRSVYHRLGPYGDYQLFGRETCHDCSFQTVVPNTSFFG